jgi:hypothetical protein
VVLAEPVANAPEPVTVRRSAALGIVAFILAVLDYLFTPLASVFTIANSGGTGGGNQYLVLLAVNAVIALVLLAFAISVAVLKRGRGWAIAAIAIIASGFGSPVQSLLAQGFIALFGLLFGAPQMIN